MGGGSIRSYDYEQYKERLEEHYKSMTSKNLDGNNMDELTTLQAARKDLETLVEQKKKAEETERYNAFLQEKANQLLGQCKVMSPEELAHSQNDHERRQNTVLALRLLSTLQSEMYMGGALNNFQKQVVALCKTQL